jgi:hypothetical protein
MSLSHSPQTGKNTAQNEKTEVNKSYSYSNTVTTQKDWRFGDENSQEQENTLVKEMVKAVEKIAENPEEHDLIEDSDDGYWFNLEDIFQNSYLDTRELDEAELDDQMWALGYALDEIDQRDQITLSIHDYVTDFGRNYHDFRKHKKDAETFGGVKIPHYRVE